MASRPLVIPLMIPLVIAHRGFSARFPENTQAAIRAAIEVGADMVEVDVQETADGKIAVFHDLLLQRLCGIPGRISQITLAQLRQCKPDVPTLSQTLRAVRGKVRLLIEMKDVDPTKVAQAIEQTGMVNQVIVFAFAPALLQQLARTNPRICRFGLVSNDLSQSIQELTASVQVEGVGVANRLLQSAADVRRLQQRVGKVFVWTVNRTARMLELAEWGVDGIITNHPDRARQLWPK